MPQQSPEPAEPSGCIIRPESGLARLPDGDSPALTEIISRSLVHIQASKALAVPERRAGEEWEFEIAPGVKMVMCWIPPGEFLMGSQEDEEGRKDDEIQHLVKITRGFWLAKTQTTQAQWQAVMGSNPSHFKGDNLPVDSVSWKDITGRGGFIEKVNQSCGVGGRFSLPTEAQWEYACRAGTAESYAGNLDEMGWYVENSDERTYPVGQKKANAWGLHDMHGNVCEWCADWYAPYDLNVVTDPTGPTDGSYRVIRGGCWRYYAYYARCAYRYYGWRHYAGLNFGFRLARGQP